MACAPCSPVHAVRAKKSRLGRSGKGRRSGGGFRTLATYYTISAAAALSAAPVRTPTKASTGRVGHSPNEVHTSASALSAAPVRRAAPVKNSDEVPAAVSRRSHLTTSVTAPVAAAVGAKGLVAVAQDLAARRAGDVVVLDRVTRHVNDLFAEDEVLATAASFSILTRIKSAWSANEKLTAKGLDHVNSLRDIAGVRVVVDEGPQPIDGEAGYALCYRVLRRLATSPYVREVTDLKDYVRAPKPNGYRSLHATIVPTSSRLPRFEIQVRTRAMDDVALHGSAAHRAYKLAAASPRVAGVV